MMSRNNGIRTILAIVVLGIGVIWVAKSAISSNHSDDMLADIGIGQHITGSGNIVDQHRDIGDVDSIEMQGGYDAAITIGSTPSLTITADDNILPAITSDVEDGNLVISTKGSISSSHRMKLAITVPSLHAVRVNSGKITIAGLGGGDLKVSVDGSADVTATGRVADLSVDIEGSGDLHFADLDAKSVDLQIEGSGKAAVKAADALDVEIDGSGDVVYSGSPNHIDKKINGSGSVTPAA